MKFVTPLVYTATLLLAAFLVLQLTLTVVYMSPLPGVWFYLAPVLLLSIVCGSVSWGLLWLEELQRPRVFDHLRRCALLYAGSLFWGFPWLSAPYRGAADGGHAVEIVALFCIVNAILADGIVLLLKRWQFKRVHSRGLS